jgi:hypothetical protein
MAGEGRGLGLALPWGMAEYTVMKVLRAGRAGGYLCGKILYEE